MRDSSGQDSEALQLLRLQKASLQVEAVLLGLLAAEEVACHAQEGALAFQHEGAHAHFHRECRPVPAAVHGLKRDGDVRRAGGQLGGHCLRRGMDHVDVRDAEGKELFQGVAEFLAGLVVGSDQVPLLVAEIHRVGQVLEEGTKALLAATGCLLGALPLGHLVLQCAGPLLDVLLQPIDSLAEGRFRLSAPRQFHFQGICIAAHHPAQAVIPV